MMIEVPLAEAPAPDSVLQIAIEGGAPIALYNLDGAFYATDDTCTHGEASLAEGEISGDEIVCPFHMGAFDIRTGEVTMPPCAEALATHRVELSGDRIRIQVTR